MDKNIIKKFAVQARRDLIEQIMNEANSLGIDEKGALSELPSSTNDIKFYRDDSDIGLTGRKIRWRSELVKLLNSRSKKSDWQTAFKDTVEEVAYTWFNRIIAIRFMEVNDYLPSRVRVLSSEEGRAEPDIIFYAQDEDLIEELGKYSPEEEKLVNKAKTTGHAYDMDQMYQMLFNKQVDALNKILPGLFEKTSDYMKLLFTPKYNSGVIKNLIYEVPEEYFDVEKEGQVEIIGWLYQYYNEEPKAEVIGLPKSVKYRDTQIARATQIFTPDWIVKYMVQNSLGKYWIKHLLVSGDKRSEDEIAKDFDWQYYMIDATQKEDVQLKVSSVDQNLVKTTLKSIRVIDPAMGSGHILVYAFDLLMQLYKSEGYTSNDSAVNIIKNNLFGLDIDSRAFQLAYFAIMMKYRANYRRAFKHTQNTNLFYISANSVNEFENFGILDNILDSEHISSVDKMFKLFENGSELGSLLDTNSLNIALIQESLDIITGYQSEQLSFNLLELKKQIQEKLSICLILRQKYNVIVANPPYMGSSRMSKHLSEFAKKNYPNSKSDLFAIFIERWNKKMLPGGYNSMVTMQSWMFLSSFEKMRIEQLNKYTISNLMHMENNVMGIAFGTAVTIFRNMHIANFDGTYHQVKTKDAVGKVPQKLPIPGNRYNRSNQANFEKIPGSPFSYWASEKLLDSFKNKSLYRYSVSPSQNVTGNNPKFVRRFWEISNVNIGKRNQWIFYAKGGGYRKWWGNLTNIINWSPEARNIYRFGDGKHASQIINEKYWYKKGITWGLITSNIPSFRVMPNGATFDKGGSSIIIEDNDIFLYTLGLLNSKVYTNLVEMLNPTLNFQVKDIRSLPLILSKVDDIKKIVKGNIDTSKADWDSNETSGGFKQHPFLSHIAEHKQNWTIEAAYAQWEKESLDRFNQLKSNEEELNKIFIDLYGLQDELTPEEDDKDVSVRKADKERDVKSFLSYFIGCVFGRYSLDSEGLAFAGGEWDSSKYHSFVPNEDNVIVLTDEDYFGDQRDIINRLKEFLTVTFGQKNLYQNLDFIASVLDQKKLDKGIESQQIIRDYFSNDFFKKDHLKIYQKRPIYWELNSGKAKGFKALIYQHRYSANTMAMIRSEYLHELQDAYENSLKFKERQRDNETDKKMIKIFEKEITNLNKKITELVKFDQELQHVASQQIEIDLDDGVVVNHKKVQADTKILTPIK